MKNNDGSVSHQKCLPFEIYEKLVTAPTTCNLRIAFNQLFLLAFFFAMRSCEYLRIADSRQKRRTRPIRRTDFAFWKNHRLVSLDDPTISEADSVSITFHFQKTELRDETVTQSSTGHPIFCPVKVAAAIITRLNDLVHSKKAATDCEIYYFIKSNGSISTLDNKAARALLRHFCKFEVDLAPLGIHPDEIGLHTPRSSSAMAMYLNGVPVYTIMLLGRWSSDAFLRYIRKQVEEFGQDVARNMIQNPRFHHVRPPAHIDIRSRTRSTAAHHPGMASNCTAASQVAFSAWR
jgi:hypothetical protein